MWSTFSKNMTWGIGLSKSMDSSNFHHVLLAVNQFFIALIMHYFAAALMKGRLRIEEGGGVFL